MSTSRTSLTLTIITPLHPPSSSLASWQKTRTNTVALAGRQMQFPIRPAQQFGRVVAAHPDPAARNPPPLGSGPVNLARRNNPVGSRPDHHRQHQFVANQRRITRESCQLRQQQIALLDPKPTLALILTTNQEIHWMTALIKIHSVIFAVSHLPRTYKQGKSSTGSLCKLWRRERAGESRFTC